LEQWGEERADFRAGTIAAVVANSVRDPKRRAKPYVATDFMPQPLEERLLEMEKRAEQEWAEIHGPLPAGESVVDQERLAKSMRMLETVKVLNAMFGGTDKREGQ